MADRIELAFRRAAAALIPRGAGVVAAVSGGSDSMALLHLLRARAGALDLRVVAAHLDHGMRRGSAADRRFVESESRRLGVPVVSERRPVSELRRRDESPEEAARRVRHGFLREIAARHECERIALGHTLDDQAETVLFRLLRGSGPTGLAGMGAAGPGPYVRPLLDLARADVRAYLDRRGLRFREDPTNRDLRYDRNRLRLRVLPLLAEMCNPQAAAHLVRAADLLREDARFLDRLAERRFRRVSRFEDGRIVLDAPRLAAQDPVLARRMTALALRRAGVDPRRITAKHVGAVLDLATGGRGRSVDLPGGRRAVRDEDAVRIE